MLLHNGGYAEEDVVPETAAVVVPTGMDDLEGGVLAMAFGTAYQGLVRPGGLLPATQGAGSPG
jgi:NADPH:quinone reductase-like Zn-dependent oxidoreductase